MASPTFTRRHTGDKIIISTTSTTGDKKVLSGRQQADLSACYRDFAQVDTKTAADDGFWEEQEVTICKAPFPVILHSMLSNPRNQEIIAWLPHGRSWKILKKMPFEEKVLPRYFKHGKMASFIRQIHGYGFRRIPDGIDCGSYYHELFLRGMPHLCTKIPRVKGNPKGKKRTRKDSEIPNFYQMDLDNPLPGNGSLSTKKTKDSVYIPANNETDQPVTTIAPANTESWTYRNSSALLDASTQSNCNNRPQTSTPIANHVIYAERAAHRDAPIAKYMNNLLSASNCKTNAANMTNFTNDVAINANLNLQYAQALASLGRNTPDNLAQALARMGRKTPDNLALEIGALLSQQIQNSAFFAPPINTTIQGIGQNVGRVLQTQGANSNDDHVTIEALFKLLELILLLPCQDI